MPGRDHGPATPTRLLCRDCQQRRAATLGRLRTRRSRGATRSIGTVTLTPREVERLDTALTRLDQLASQAPPGDPIHAVSARILRLLRQPVAMAMEEIVENRRPQQRRARRR